MWHNNSKGFVCSVFMFLCVFKVLCKSDVRNSDCSRKGPMFLWFIKIGLTIYSNPEGLPHNMQRGFHLLLIISEREWHRTFMETRSVLLKTVCGRSRTICPVSIMSELFLRSQLHESFLVPDSSCNDKVGYIPGVIPFPISFPHDFPFPYDF
jgi:hypothetical protein